MAIKCLNCGSPCLETETSCPFCRGPVHCTDYKLKGDGGMGKKGAALGTMFMTIGICVWNCGLGASVMPSASSSEKILAAGGVGMLCAFFGMAIGWLLHGTD